MPSENFESRYEDGMLQLNIPTSTAAPNQDFWDEDGISLVGNPYYSPGSSDTISFGNDVITGSRVYGGSSDDMLSNHFEYKLPMSNKNHFWKFKEDETLKAIEDYLASTYHSHYTSEESKTQTLDLIQSIGDAEPFTRSNAIKYLSRFGKKNGKSKMDILKAIHYCILLYYFAGLHNENKGTYETF